MKRSTLPVLAIFFVLVLAACAGNNPSTSSANEDRVATIVAGTLSAMPTPVPTLTIPSAKLKDFPNKELAGENDRYAVYVINSSGSDPMDKTGGLIVYDKSAAIVHEIIGTFRLSGSVILSNDDQGVYVLLSTGTYTSRTAIVVSLNDKKQAISDFCVSSGQFGSHLFWNDYVIYNTCDKFSNRPWGAGEAPGIAAVNLKTGAITDIAKSDLTHQFNVKEIAGSNLQYVEVSVEKEDDWQNPDSQKTAEMLYDLLSLGK